MTTTTHCPLIVTQRLSRSHVAIAASQRLEEEGGRDENISGK